MTSPQDPPLRLPPPTETLVVGQDGQVLLIVGGALVLPLGSRVQLDATGPEVSVVGVRLVGADSASAQLLLEVDAGGSSFRAAVIQANAEAQVVAAAEDIAQSQPDGAAGTPPDLQPPEPEPV